MVRLCLLGDATEPQSDSADETLSHSADKTPTQSTDKPPSNSADKPSRDIPRQLVEEVLLPSLQQGLQLQIDAAKASTDLLKKVRGRERGEIPIGDTDEMLLIYSL